MLTGLLILALRSELPGDAVSFVTPRSLVRALSLSLALLSLALSPSIFS